MAGMTEETETETTQETTGEEMTEIGREREETRLATTSAM